MNQEKNKRGKKYQMARLPQVGGDSGDWGSILNEYLLQSLNTDGTLKDAIVDTAQLANASVTTSKLANGAVGSAKVAGFGAANGFATLDADGRLLEAQVPERLSESKLLGLSNASRYLGASQDMRARRQADRTRPFPALTLLPLRPNIEANLRVPFETDLGSSTVTPSAPDIVTTPVAHGLSIGDRVRFADRVTLSYTNGNPYTVRTVPSSTTFTVYASNGTTGGDADLTNTAGTARVIKGVPYEISTWDRAAATITGDVTGDALGDNMLISSTPHGLRVGDSVGFLSSTIGGVANDTRYWVKTVLSEDRFQIASDRSGSVSVTLSIDGTATLTKASGKFAHLRYPVIQRSFTSPGYNIGTADTGFIAVGAGTATGSPPERRFILSAAQLGIRIFRSGSTQLAIYIDGALWKFITDADIVAVGVSSGSIAVLGITFPDVRNRVISIVGSDLQGLYVQAPTDVVATALPTGLRLAVVGDSFTEATGASRTIDAFSTQVCQLLGFQDGIPMGSGSTGYSADGTRLAWEDHWQDVVNARPNIVLWALGINDAAIAPATVTAAAIACWQGVATALPDTRQIVLGPWPNGGGTGVIAELQALDAALQTEAEARGYFFISPIQDGVTFTRSDATHPNQAGHDTLAIYVAAKLLLISVNGRA